MMEDKLINNEETKKFKRAVDLFKGANYSAETMLRISLIFYFATKRVLQIFDAEKYTDNRGLAAYMRELNTPPSLKSHEEYYILSSTNIHPYIQCESETGIRFLQVERKHIPSHIWECIDYVHDNTLLYSEYDKSTELDWRRNNLISYAEDLISLSDKWYSENAINAFNYIQEIFTLDREFRNEIPFLPSNVTELIGELLGATDGYVYNPHAQFGEFIGVIDKGAIYHGEEDSVRAYIVQLRLLLEGRYNSKCDMGRTKNWEDLSNKYDFIVSNIPGPLGISFFIKSSQNTLRKSVGIYTSDICFPTKMFHIKGVENLLKQDLIETVIQLPTEIFSNKQISTVIIVANKKKQQKGRVHLIDARNCYINKGEYKVLDLNRIAIMLNDLGEHDHHKYISNESITNNNCNILPQTYNEIPTPKGFQLISLKQILTQSRINKTIANEGFLFTPKDAQPYKTSSYLELPQIDGVTVKIPETTVLSNSGEHVEQRLGGIVNDDFLAINSILLNPYYITTDNHPVFVSPISILYVYKLDTSQILPSYLLTEMSKDYFKNQTATWRQQTGRYRISSEQFLELKILVPEKFEDQVTLALEAGNKDLKEHWKQLEEQYQKKFEDFRNGQRQRKHAVAQVLNDLSPAVDLVKTFVDNNDNFGTNSIVSNKSNTTLLAYMQTIQHQLNRVVDMVDKFTNSEKYSEAENIQINEFLEEYCKHQRVNEKYRITLDTSNDIYWTAPSEEYDNNDEEGFTLTVKMGRAELTQILDNLITNANKHGFTASSRTDYEIRLTTEVVTEATPKLLLKVANNGDPVSRSLQLEKLFTWGGSNGNGTGLGCWQAKDLAEHYNGTLTYQEHPNDENGFVCEFTLSLPLHFD